MARAVLWIYVDIRKTMYGFLRRGCVYKFFNCGVNASSDKQTGMKKHNVQNTFLENIKKL